MNTLQSTIERKLGALEPIHVEVVNESHMHSGPATDSHFKLVVVSAAFEGIRAVARHQRVYQILAEELAGEVHALALHLYTPNEWQVTNSVPASPNCKGGSLVD
ncbi:MAG: BolA family protein [Thalassolituus sp.]|jgi:BolA protein|uniref:BolA family protein n=1 Tax=Thalassolituus TaxID=187492 RepID=UPI0023F01E45|nr:BolA family protein [Thalassolituus oleivorans]